MIKMMNSLVCSVVVLVLAADLLNSPARRSANNQPEGEESGSSQGQASGQWPPSPNPRGPTRGWFLLQGAEAKGVAGLGKAGGDGSAGSDKNGQQVPPEVYNALTYAGSAFLLTLSVPLLLYTLNKLLNVIEDCFGCGPASRRRRQASNSHHHHHHQHHKGDPGMGKEQAPGQVSHLFLDDKQKLFNEFAAPHSSDITGPAPLVNGNHASQHLQNLLIAQHQAAATTNHQLPELLLNPLTIPAADTAGPNHTGSVRPSFSASKGAPAGNPPPADQMIQNFQQQFIIS